ncbi:septum site-determining protein MinC [Uliginosibacterium sp. H1]|uniref:septum site-determining protein MinC n=1 Tax=Uliginosibacterium sp. H1 TaxID=3114757 RepID=UPI002E19644B|nr:septum site-determining protein MinC [Uliginosibacterium sp. H1]
MSKPIEFKAGTLSAVTALIRELDNVRLADTLHAMLGGTGEFFAGEPAVIDLSQLKTAPERADWSGLGSLLRRHGLQPVGVRHVPEHLADSARKAGLAVLGDKAASSNEQAVTAPTAAKAEPAPAAEPAARPEEATRRAPTMVIDRSVRSGQQIYARGTDLVILGGVSNGAEVIADGSIHCYGPLRGRALAGAQGDATARLLCTNFGPELVSIAGVYRTFEKGIPPVVAGKAAHARLVQQNNQNSLSIEALTLD